VIIATGLLRDDNGRSNAITLSNLGRGVHRFECLIHPWMQSTVTVR
jgi:plastocyanin